MFGFVRSLPRFSERDSPESGPVMSSSPNADAFAAVHGYDLYYLNVMAGPVRTWKFHNAAEHEWMLKAR